MAREWERALERQLALLEYSKTGSQMVWLNVYRQTLAHQFQGSGWESPRAATAMAAELADTLGYAETFFVGSDMCDLVEVAAGSVGDPVLESHIPFSKMGFVYFQRPFSVYDGAEAVPLKISGVLWSVQADVASVDRAGREIGSGPGVYMFWFGQSEGFEGSERWLAKPRDTALFLARIRRERQALMAEWDSLTARLDGLREDYVATYGQAEWEKNFGPELDRQSVLEVQIEETRVEEKYALSETWDPRRAEARVRRLVEPFTDRYVPAPAGLLMVDMTAWTYGTPWGEVPQSSPTSSTECAPVIAAERRILYSLWSLMAQQIGKPVSEVASRQYKRRWERQVTPPPNYGDVRVVTLRRLAPGDQGGDQDEEFGREWSHRWVVRGHWRQQWYPSEGVHRLIWIEPFIKGPEHRPLIVKDRVFEVVR